MRVFYVYVIFLLCVFSSINAQTTTTGLIASYPFNGNANNAVSPYNNGYVTYAALTTDILGRKDSAYLFHGYYDEQISCGNDPIGDSASVTVSALIYPTTGLHTGFSTSENQYIISTGGQSGSVGYFMLWNNGRIWAGRKSSTTICDTIVGIYPPNKWYKIAFTFEQSTGLLSMYVNDSLVVTKIGKSGYSLTHSFKTMVIGAPNTPYVAGFVGKIDDVKIYNRALSFSEVTGRVDETAMSLNTVRESAQIKVYPNPATDYVCVDISHLERDFSRYSIQFINSTGKLINTARVESYKTYINVGRPKTEGLYLIQLVDENQNIVAAKKIFIR